MRPKLATDIYLGVLGTHMSAELKRSGQNTALSDRCRWCKYARCCKVTTSLAPVGHLLPLHHGVLVQSCSVLHQNYSGVLGQYSGVLVQALHWCSPVVYCTSSTLVYWASTLVYWASTLVYWCRLYTPPVACRQIPQIWRSSS